MISAQTAFLIMIFLAVAGIAYASDARIFTPRDQHAPETDCCQG